MRCEMKLVREAVSPDQLSSAVPLRTAYNYQFHPIKIPGAVMRLSLTDAFHER
jgi:hypothetical protein